MSKKQSKAWLERERQWGSKVKGSSVLQNISKRMSSLQKGCVYLFYSQVGRDKLSLHELNKSTSVYSQAEGQGSPGRPWNMIIIIKASQRNNFQHGVRIGFLPAIMWLSFDLWVGSVVWDFWIGAFFSEQLLAFSADKMPRSPVASLGPRVTFKMFATH